MALTSVPKAVSSNLAPGMPVGGMLLVVGGLMPLVLFVAEYFKAVPLHCVDVGVADSAEYYSYCGSTVPNAVALCGGLCIVLPGIQNDLHNL